MVHSEEQQKHSHILPAKKQNVCTDKLNDQLVNTMEHLAADELNNLLWSCWRHKQIKKESEY